MNRNKPLEMLLIMIIFVIVLMIYLTGCVPQTHNDHDVIGEIVINANGKTCLNYELCNK
jgi:hypothetical protein